MEIGEVEKRLRERVYFEAKAKYKKADFESRVRDVLYERSETFSKIRSMAYVRKFKKLTNPINFERFMLKEGRQIIDEVIDGLNNQPRMLATEYEKKVVDVLKQNLRSGIYMDSDIYKERFSKPEGIDKYIADSKKYKFLKKRLRDEQDSKGLIYCDIFDYWLIQDACEIENEIFVTIMFEFYEAKLNEQK